MRSQLLDTILEKYLEEIPSKNFLFVVPSKRSAFYGKDKLKKKLAEKKVSCLMPLFITPDELIEHITDLIILSKTDLLYHLYKSYKKVFNEKADEYHIFIKWANMLLNDFNDILMAYPGNTEKQKQIFTTLRDIKDIEHWSLNREPLSENQKKYLELMSSFYEIFTDFNQHLLENNYAYSGLAYQKAVQNINDNILVSFINRIDTFIFVGLNAINPAEKIIYTKLKNNKKALFYWDYDRYYTEDINHEAGKFLRENFLEFNNEIKKETSFFEQKKTFFIASASNEVEEALFIKKTLSEIKAKDPELKNVAIILNKPDNLNLILSAVPEGVEYNVSMEYPLYLTSAYQFLMQMFRIFNDDSSKDAVYYKNFINLILNPFFKHYAYYALRLEERIIQQMVNLIKKQNIIYFPLKLSEKLKNAIFIGMSEQEKQIKELNLSAFLSIFTNKNVSDILKAVVDLFNNYLALLIQNEKKDIILINILQSIVEQLNRIEDIIQSDDGVVFTSMKDIYAFLQQVLSKESVAFRGEPLRGLQILGLLESRLLDFDTIIIPFMNEGYFPSNHYKPSFLPFDLRTHYQLPTYYNDDAISSYLFYRNLHQPKDIYISYNNIENTEDIGIRSNAAEQSRYIQQIVYELSQNKNITVHTPSIRIIDQGSDIENTIEIEKTKDIIEQLKNLVYSPTSVTTYLDCSLKFYFNYILKLKIPDDAAEELRSDMEGVIFHKVMSCIFHKYQQKSIDIDEIKHQYIEKPDEIKSIIHTEIAKLNLENKGKVLIQTEILCEDMIKFLHQLIQEYNNKNINIQYIENTEDAVNNDIVELNGIKLYGRPDRIDYLPDDNLYTIIDYKSSFYESYDSMNFFDIENIFDDSTKKQKNINKQIQLLIYIYYAFEKQLIQSDIKNDHIYVTGAILPLKLKKLDNSIIHLHQYIKNNNDILKINATEIKSKIIPIIERIFNELILNNKKNFGQTQNLNTCTYCDFNTICKRI